MPPFQIQLTTSVIGWIVYGQLTSTKVIINHYLEDNVIYEDELESEK